MSSQELKDKMAALKEALPEEKASVPKVQDTPEAIKAAIAAAASPTPKEERQYQTYFHSMSSSKMLTDKGTPIIFQEHKCYTDVQEVMDYLDKEIAGGLKLITKGELVTSEDLDPMAAIKKRVIAEYLKDQEKLAAAGKAQAGSGIMSSAMLTTGGASTSADAGASE